LNDITMTTKDTYDNNERIVVKLSKTRIHAKREFIRLRGGKVRG